MLRAPHFWAFAEIPYGTARGPSPTLAKTHWTAGFASLTSRMFKLASQYSFEPDAEMCWLSASSGYSDEFSWQLHLESQVALTHFPAESAPASFGIYVRPPLGLINWQELSRQSVTISEEESWSAFMFHCDMSKQWEDLVDLHLQFSQLRGTQIEVLAKGLGCIEAAPDIFPSTKVQFQIHTWATFRGVRINVPLNASDPVGYSEARIKALVPRYAYLPPRLRKTSDDDGAVLAVEVLLAPNESKTGVL